MAAPVHLRSSVAERSLEVATFCRIISGGVAEGGGTLAALRCFVVGGFDFGLFALEMSYSMVRRSAVRRQLKGSPVAGLPLVYFGGGG